MVLWAIAAAHNAAALSLTHEYFGEFTASFLERMDDVIANIAITRLVSEEWDREIEEESVSAIRRFMESLMASSYEGHAAEIAVSLVNKKQGSGSRVKLEELLESKKTSALFAGHRQVLLSNLAGEAFRQVTLPPYPDVTLPSKGALYPAPYEYQPVLHFSHQQNALTFLLSRRREVVVVLGSQLLLLGTIAAGGCFPLKDFSICWLSGFGSMRTRICPKREGQLIAICLCMIGLTLRHRGKGGLIVIQQPDSKMERFLINPSPAESFYQSILRDQWILTAPVSLVCNAASIDGATVLSYRGEIKRFGVVLNTEKIVSESEGARTRAAEYASATGVAIKVSE
ncbi:MAG TPA: hypothetical protein VJS64_15750, partial [Pyrinomonadaceae bacterium]|nr:hypothetical protein [Pyrinomonadaceae bacterium]